MVYRIQILNRSSTKGLCCGASAPAEKAEGQGGEEAAETSRHPGK